MANSEATNSSSISGATSSWGDGPALERPAAKRQRTAGGSKPSGKASSKQQAQPERTCRVPGCTAELEPGYNRCVQRPLGRQQPRQGAW